MAPARIQDAKDGPPCSRAAMSVPFRPRFNQRAEPISLAGFALVVIVGFLMLLVLLVGVID